MKTCFLLGSGISIPANLPSVKEITDRVLAITPAEVDWPAVRTHPPNILIDFRTPKRERLGHFLRWLKSVAEARYPAEAGRQVNYEDLAYLATQIRDDLLGEYENPALGPLIHCAKNSLLGLGSECDENLEEDLENLAIQALDRTFEVIVRMLKNPHEQLDYLRLFRDAAIALSVGEVNLFTLNHDCLLEEYLRSEEFNVIDGFVEQDGLPFRVWNPDVFDQSTALENEPAVRLFKLHGSIDWRRFRPIDENPDNPWREEYVGTQSCSLNDQRTNVNGCTYVVSGHPLLLAGTFNKLPEYLNHVFLELHYRFHRTLNESSRLVVCGYGFGDKGINNRITDWMGNSPDSTRRKMIVIDPKSLEKMRETARFAISGKITVWMNEERFIHLPYRLGDTEVNWDRISASLNED